MNQVVIPEVVALDIETTGLDAEKGDRICEIALLRIAAGQIQQKLVTLVNPEREISFPAHLVHRITPQMVEKSPRFREIAPLVSNFIQGKTLLIHNAGFDLTFLKIQMDHCGLSFPETSLVDTLQVARHFFNYPSNNLYALAERLHIPINLAWKHRAEPDAWTAYAILEHLWKDLRRSGIRWENIVSSTRRVDISLKAQEILPEILLQALGKTKRVAIRYIERDNQVITQEIEPIEIVREEGGIYLLSLCPDGRQEKKFRLDHIMEVVENIQ
ncbi:MAG: exonuclease domain-containing protein [Candidatus Omnitrophica bacterium]|nr:exonuclease domain-containing protein [Candidatus Omnitrophota bacterium]